jgi:hypothetical protein
MNLVQLKYTLLMILKSIYNNLEVIKNNAILFSFRKKINLIYFIAVDLITL